MPELRDRPLRGSGITTGTATRNGMRRDYVLIGEAERDAGNPSPRQIVAALHRAIAAKSPKHAALVAAFEQKQVPSGPGVHHQVAACRERMERYAGLREDGATPDEAAAGFALRRSTAHRYEAHYKAARRGDGTLVFPWTEQQQGGAG